MQTGGAERNDQCRNLRIWGIQLTEVSGAVASESANQVKKRILLDAPTLTLIAIG